MPIRPLDLRDLPNLYRFRDEAIGLDTARMLTRGSPLGAAGLISYVNPARHIHTAVAEGDGAAVLGGVIHSLGETFAKLLYVAPSSRLDHPDLPALIEHLCAEAGSWGAFHVIAEVDETSQAFPSLRRAGFSVYAWQRMWDVSQLNGGQAKIRWERMREAQITAVQSLYQQIVPPLLHPVEPMPKHAAGFICNEGVKCYVHLNAGANGIALSPLIHPEAVEVGAKLSNLVETLPGRRGRPVYLCVRSYQAWLEPVLADLGASAGPRQAVMVKHLARLIKDEQAVRTTQPAGVSVQPSHLSRMDGGKK
ncbi:MAG: hypothetical protein ACOY0R_11135 [Chloroflexota bacterium]